MIEVEEHKDDLWMIIDDDIYYFTSMINHSGGLDIIKQLSSKDVTRIFITNQIYTNKF
jgi:cytochrome b involved in lipid metabolism